MRVTFSDEGQEGYEGDGGYRLTIEDDGHGPNNGEHIIDRALRRQGLVSPTPQPPDRTAAYRLHLQSAALHHHMPLSTRAGVGSMR